MTTPTALTLPRALVTGASSGIGRVYAERLAARGFALVIVARDRDRLQALADTLTTRHGTQSEVLVADLADAQARARVETRLRREPDVDWLVNSAGFATYGAFAETDLTRTQAELDVLVTSVVRLTHAALVGMRARGRGTIVNVSSTTSFRPGPFQAIYGASKAFVTSFTEAIAEEQRDSDVRVQVLCPGATRTEFFERAGLRLKNTSAAGWASPEEVVDHSLAALEAGEVVCIPKFTNRVDVFARRFIPRGLMRRLAGRVGRAAARARERGSM